MTGVGIVCAACAARPAQAAHWDLTLEVTGNAHIESNGQVDNREANVFGQGGRRDPRASLSPQIVTTYNPDRTVTYTAQPATSQVDMDCVVVMTWTADPYRDGNTLPAPPDTASFLVTIGGLANNEFNGGPLVRSELELGDLFDAESIVRVQPAGGTTLLDGQHQEKDNFYVKLNDQSDERRIQSCSFLLQQATEGQSVVRWKAPHLKSLVHIAGGAMPNNNTQGSGGAYLSFIAVSDDRSLKLSRGGRYEYSKLVNGKWNTYGDSIYSARDASGFANNDRKTEDKHYSFLHHRQPMGRSTRWDKTLHHSQMGSARFLLHLRAIAKCLQRLLQIRQPSHQWWQILWCFHRPRGIYNFLQSHGHKR